MIVGFDICSTKHNIEVNAKLPKFHSFAQRFLATSDADKFFDNFCVGEVLVPSLNCYKNHWGFTEN